MLRRYYDEIFGEKKPVELNKPYHEYGKEEITEFAEQQKASCQKIMEKYFSKEEELTLSTFRRTEREEYSTCKGITLNRGIYHPGDGFELAVTNIGRGHRLKKIPDENTEYYCFGFDKGDNLLCAERRIGQNVIHREILIRENDMEYGLVFQQSGLNYIYAAGYNGSKLLYTYRFSRYGSSVNDICLYEYDESGRRSSVLIVFNEVYTMPDYLLYTYEYDNNDLLGIRDKSGHLISVRGGHARKYITAARVMEAMKDILVKWDNIPGDVYALSVYFEDNKADGSSSFSLGYNTEEAASGYDTDEARWNYAYWLQNEKELFGEPNYVYVRNIESCGSLALLSNAVKLLHKSGKITDKFGHELPVIIHELEYYPEIAEYNIKANGKKLIPQEFIDFCGGIYG